MIKLVKNEFRKFNNSYISIVTIVTMLFPVIFTSLFYYFDSDSFVFTWEAYVNSLNLFYGIFFASLIPSFIAIFSVYYEFKEGTIKNLVSSPYTRVQIIISKILYVSIFTVMLYVFAAILVLFAGILIGLDTTWQDVLMSFKRIAIPGITAVVFVPIMVFLTLICQNFVAPIIISFIGTIVGIPMINMGQSSFYPWLIPANFFFRVGNTDLTIFTLPSIFLCVYLVVFSILSILKFKSMDFDSL